jgi:hypothetical protein
MEPSRLAATTSYRPWCRAATDRKLRRGEAAVSPTEVWQEALSLARARTWH